MRYIFLDDDEKRIAIFLKWFPQAEAVRTASEMIQELQKELVGWIFLDHDLRGIKYDDSSRDDCGMEVVRWIVQNKPLIEVVVLHTCNMVASPEMKRQLEESGYLVHQIPFPFLFKKLKRKNG